MGIVERSGESGRIPLTVFYPTAQAEQPQKKGPFDFSLTVNAQPDAGRHPLVRALIGQDTARALAMLDHLDDYLRTTLQASRQPLHPLADEFSRLDDYLSLMAIRMGPRLVFDLDLPHALVHAPVPSFILQPLVENAIRHGLEPMVAGGRIEVQASTEGAMLLLTVRDNGCGISELALADSVKALPHQPASNKPFESWGLSHVRQRLHTLYGERASMRISAVSTGGSCVVLTLPLTSPV